MHLEKILEVACATWRENVEESESVLNTTFREASELKEHIFAQERQRELVQQQFFVEEGGAVTLKCENVMLRCDMVSSSHSNPVEFVKSPRRSSWPSCAADVRDDSTSVLATARKSVIDASSSRRRPFYRRGTWTGVSDIAATASCSTQTSPLNNDGKDVINFDEKLPRGRLAAGVSSVCYVYVENHKDASLVAFFFAILRSISEFHAQCWWVARNFIREGDTVVFLHITDWLRGTKQSHAGPKDAFRWLRADQGYFFFLNIHHNSGF